MAFNLEKAMTAPKYGREENRLYVKHPKIGDGQKYYYLGVGIESLAYNIEIETEERQTIAEEKAIVTNKAGGITFPAEFRLKDKSPVYDGLYSLALMDKINEEFELLFVFANMGIKDGGTLVPDAVFAKSSKGKFTISSIGNDGTQPIVITSEGKTSGNILNGYVEVSGYAEEPETWAGDAFTEVVNGEPIRLEAPAV